MTANNSSKTMLWSGRIIRILVSLFLLVDAIMKVLETAPSMQGCEELGWPLEAVQGIGLVLLSFTVLFMIRSTAILGAMLLTAYLGGATAVMILAAKPGHPYLFPIVFCVFVWAGLFFQDDRLRQLIPWRKD